MTKLEDKLTASIKKPGQQKKTDAAPTTQNTAKSKATARTPAKQKQTKQQPANSGTNQSVLHPQRIWPD